MTSATFPEAVRKPSSEGSVPASFGKLLAAMLKGLAAPVFVVAGARHEIWDCNEPLAELFGYRREELLGVSASILSAGFEGVDPRRGGAKEGIFEAGSSHHVLPGRGKSGRVFLCSVDCVGLRGEGGEYVAAFCLVRDLSHERAREAALRRAADSLASLSRELERIAAPLSSELAPSLGDFGLTPRQLEVLLLAAEGLSSKEIGARLGIAESTAKNHLAAVFERLGVSSRMELVRMLADTGLKPIP